MDFQAVDRKKALGRGEFILALIHMAIRKYVLPGHILDISQALDELLRVDIITKVGVACIPPPDSFRRCYCYTRSMCAFLGGHEASLRRLFEFLARGRKSFPLERWMSFLRALSFIGDDVSERDALRAFAWSRMCVTNEATPAGHVKENTLPFEGMLEALIRLSILKALPAREDIEAANCEDAYTYVQLLAAEDTEGYKAFLQDRSTPWGEVPRLPHPDERMEHLLCMIACTVQAELGIEGRRFGIFDLQEHELSKWQSTMVLT